MAADEFFARWSKRKTEATPSPAVSDRAVEHEAQDAPAVTDPHTMAEARPTLADTEGLTAESDYTVFVAKGVDEAVKRRAMKKLFALPRFNTMDGLDTYVGDYSQADPLPPDMLLALNHAKSALSPARIFAKPVPEQTSTAENPSEAIPLTPGAAAGTPDYPAPAPPDEDPRSTLVQRPDVLPPVVGTLKNEAV